MKRILLVAVFAVYCISAFSNETWFLYSPSLSPDGKKIVFAFEGDLWIVPSSGGTAFRLTGMNGNETLPRFSPDGKWIAFTGNQDGNANVYVVPSEGGDIKQLTFHSAADNVDSWSWDSKQIYFTSGQLNSFSSFRVSVSGGTPERLFGDNYWNNAHFVVEDKKTGAFVFSESGESYRSDSRKRYKGENNPDIESYLPKTNEYKQLTNYIGKDLWPTIDINGKIYFASDEANGEYNLYTLQNGQKLQLTNFISSIGRPQVNASGEKVVFIRDYQIFMYDVAAKKTEKVPVDVFANNSLVYDQRFEVQNNINGFDVSPDNKKLVFISRGELFVSDIKGKFVKQIKTTPGERVMEAIWSKDNKTLVIIRTSKGWPNLFSINADGKSSEKPIGGGDKTARMLTPDKERKNAVYYFGKDELRLVNLETLEDKLLLKDEFWFRGSTPGFSPDNNYVIFTAFRHFEQDILVHNLKTGKTTNLTKTYLSEGDPFWSPDGKYIYFTADRSKPSYPRGGGNNRLYRLPLQKYQEPFRSTEFDALFGQRNATDKNIRIDTTNLLFRWEQVENINPSQGSPYVTSKDTTTYVIFTSTHEGKQKLFKLTINPFEPNKVEEIKGVTNGDIVAAGKEYYILSSGNIYKLNLSGNSTEKIDITFGFSRNLADEFRQMFYEGWTILAENYYDSKMHNTDWPAIRGKYEKFLPYIKSRNDLRIVMNDMLGELNSSHMGFSSSGTEEKINITMRSVGTGIIFENDKPYVVNRIINTSPSDNYETDIKPGDLLVSVDGRKVDQAVNREYYFSMPDQPAELKLGFERAGKYFETKIHPVPAASINGLLYDEWIEKNQKTVDKLTSNEIAYVYLKNMGDQSLAGFLIEMTSEAVDRKGLILDLRYNTGGNIHDDLLNFLSQKPYLEWKFRDGQISPQPHFAPAGKPIVVLINDQSLSDAEMTSAGFKALKLGTIVGTETYRWIIFTSAKGFVDGSSIRLPAWGCYTLDGKDLESEGVKPDIYVKNAFLDRLHGKDPQLEKAIEVIMKQIKK